jgi:peroxiredoxin
MTDEQRGRGTLKKGILFLSLLAPLMLMWAPVEASDSSIATVDGVPLEELMSGIRLTPLSGEMTAPDFTLTDLSGHELKLSDFRGKVVLLNFFATWCASCVWEMPEMEALYKAYKDKGFAVLAVSLDFAGPEKVKKFAQKKGLTFPIVMDTRKEVAKKYGLKGPPLTYLIDVDGRMIGGVLGPTSWSDRRAFKIVEHFLDSGGASTR